MDARTDDDSGNHISYVPHFELVRWGPAMRTGAGLLGLGGLIASRQLKGLPREVVSFLSISLGLRALLNKDLTQALGTLLAPTIKLQRTIEVDAPVDEVERFWTTLENYPRFMSFVKNVTTNEHGNLLWELAGPGGLGIHVEAFIKSWWPSRAISWVSAPGSSLYHSGKVLLRPLPFERCQVSVELAYALRAGTLGFALARMLGTNPRARIDADLAKMKELVEGEWRKKRREDVVPLS